MRLSRVVAATLAGMSLSTSAIAAPLQTAVFAGGCFWTVEKGFESIPGVVEAVSGFSGGAKARPTYANHDGHLEAVKVTFDPAKVSYRQLTDRFWRMIDPTDNGGQACDRGYAYRTAVFATPAQTSDAQASRAAVDTGKLKGKIVTPIRAASAFWPAEAKHQDFYKNNVAHYAAYNVGCGRPRVLEKIWGKKDA